MNGPRDVLQQIPYQGRKTDFYQWYLEVVCLAIRGPAPFLSAAESWANLTCIDSLVVVDFVGYSVRYGERMSHVLLTGEAHPTV